MLTALFRLKSVEESRECGLRDVRLVAVEPEHHRHHDHHAPSSPWSEEPMGHLFLEHISHQAQQEIRHIGSLYRVTIERIESGEPD